MRSLFKRLAATSVVLLIVVVCSYFIAPQKTLAASWEQVGTSGFGGGAANQTVYKIVGFNDMLYASIGNLATGVGIFRSADGATWTQVNTNGFGSATNVDATMIVYNGALYAGTITTGAPDMAQLWMTINGTSWLQIGNDGFGDPQNEDIVGLEEFNGKLYIGLNNLTTGAEVFELDNVGSLVQANVDAFGGENSGQVWVLKEYNGALYAGTAANAGAEIWKKGSGATWSPVMQGGFGDANNMRINTLFVFGGDLYAGTLNQTTGTEIWRTTTSDSNWEQVNTDGFGDANTLWAGDQVAIINGTIYLGTRNMVVGAKLFVSTNGSTWTQEGADGFGDPTNNFAMYAVTFNGRIYLGISSQTGAEIWRTGTIDTLSITTTSFTIASLGDETVGSAYTIQLSTSAGTAPFVWSLTSGSLPDGQSLNTSTGIISGTPSRSGTYTFTVSVVDSGNPQQLASRELSIKVVDAPAVAVLPETGGNHYFNWAGGLI